VAQEAVTLDQAAGLPTVEDLSQGLLTELALDAWRTG
jgi:hypothetical protein